jgi:alpha-tubulin suppressor-like RCC1 family protein
MNKIRMRSALVILAMLFSFVNVSPVAAACTSSGSPAVTTDKVDYGPHETVTISGSGFGCGEVLSVLVTAPDGSIFSGDGTGSAGPDAVTPDENGAFVLSYQLSGTLPDGDTYTGQLGTYTVDVRNSSGAVLASTTFTDGGSALHTCAVTTSGDAKCWGYGGSGALGDGNSTTSALPVDVFGSTSSFAQISTGGFHTCAVTISTGAKCWGFNSYGQLGDDTFTSSALPVAVSGLASGIAEISTGFGHTCVLTTSSGVKCWGFDGSGALGDGSFDFSPPYGRATPADVSGLTNGVAQISVGGYHTCALTTSGGVKCWGGNYFGALGDNGMLNTSTPGDVVGLTSGVAQISAGAYYTCALMTTGGVKCWGYNFQGQLGNGTFTTGFLPGIRIPVDVIGLNSGVAQISAGADHTCALLTTGAVKCWGANSNGALGDGTFTESAVPVDVISLTGGVTQISAGADHTCALTTSGGIQCWGSNTNGALGDGTFTNRATPVDVSGLTSGIASLPEIVGNTPPGNNVSVQPIDTTTSTTPVTLTFAQVTQAGATSLTTSSAGPPPPLGFRLGNPNIYYELTTTAVFSGTITICINYTGTSFENDPNESTLILDHLEGGNWQDRTVFRDGASNIICADVTSLSPFAIFVSAYQFSGFFQPVDNLPTLNSVKAGQAIPVKFSLGGDQGLNIFAVGYPKSEQITCNSNVLVDGIEETVTPGASSLTYDPGSDQYHYVWKTQKSWANTCRQLVVKFVDGTTQRANFKFK